MAPPSAQTTQRGLTQKVSLIVALVVFEIGGFWDQDNTKRSIFCICRSQVTSKINQFFEILGDQPRNIFNNSCTLNIK
jgi:hypothetical protein